MAVPYNALVSQIMADVSSNQRLRTDLNREHVFDAIRQVLPALVRQYMVGGKQVPLTPFCWTIPRLDVQVADFTQGGLLPDAFYESRDSARAFGLPVEQLRQYVRLPELVNWGGFVGLDTPAIDYLGPLNGRVRLDIYSGPDYVYAAQRRVTGRQPFAWLNENVAWLFAPTTLAWPQLTLRGVLADIRQAGDFGRMYDENTTPFPCPDDFADELVKQLTNRYISMYGRYSHLAPSDGNLPQL